MVILLLPGPLASKMSWASALACARAATRNAPGDSRSRSAEVPGQDKPHSMVGGVATSGRPWTSTNAASSATPLRNAEKEPQLL